MNKILITYFSSTGTTKNIALKLSKDLNAEIFEIEPVKPYSSKDLNWMDKNARSTIEGNNPSLRPEIKTKIDIASYDTIYVGFPIWWYRAPNIINTFLEQYDFSNKEILLFATSGGSGFGKTIEGLRTSVSNSCMIKEYKMFR